MDQDVAREAEEDTGPQSQEELPESQSQSENSGSEMEDWEEEEDGEDMDSSWESEPDPIIFQLVQNGNLAAVTQILKSDRSAVHLRDSMNHTPIHAPSSMGLVGDESRALAIVKLLLSYGAPVNSQTFMSYPPLHIACVTGKEKICNLLLTNGARYDLKQGFRTPPDCANGKMEILKMFRR